MYDAANFAILLLAGIVVGVLVSKALERIKREIEP